MWNKILSTTLGRVAGAVALVFLGFFGTVMVSYWHSNVASPKYVDQRVDEKILATRTELQIEVQDVRKEILTTKHESRASQGKIVEELEKIGKSQLQFQTQMKADVNYLKGTVGDLKEDSKEIKERLREVESGNSGG